MTMKCWCVYGLAALAVCWAFSPASALAGDDTATEESAADLFGLMYWTNRPEGIYRAARDGSEVKLLIESKNADGLAIDAERGKIYWTVSNTPEPNDKVCRANLDGSGVEELLSGLNWTGDMVLDPQHGKLYISSLGEKKIIEAAVDGSQTKDLIVGLNGVDELAIDLEHGKLYWSNSGSGEIKRANLDGTQVEDAVTGPRSSFGLAIDATNQKLYWINLTAGSIERAGLDGKNVEQLVSGLVQADGLAIDAYNRKLYWTENGKISQANADGSEAEVLVSGKTSQFSSIVILPPRDAGE